MKRFICHFLIAWLALLSGGAHSHATADAAHEMSHAAEMQLDSALDDLVSSPDAKQINVAHGSEHNESCSLSHCGHSHVTGMLMALNLNLSPVPVGAPMPTLQSWASREQPDSIERPKWHFTTPAVVNL